jgi:adenosylmethionine-8-amino-7-oxononanoate aminotransferase
MAEASGVERDGHVFHRVLTRDLPRAVRAHGLWIEDADGRRYLDAAGGAIVVNVGHGDRSLVDAMAAQSAATPYVHGTMFTTEALEAYADDLAPVLPLDDPRIYPVSGGSEAVETALKLARAYHLANGDETRTLVLGRRPSYHGNTLGALDVGGKEALRRPYAPWLGRFHHVEAPYEYRCRLPGHPVGCGAALASALESAILEVGVENVAAFVAEPVAGASLAAAVPADDYWPAVAEVCRRHGVLLIADEVMTGFGRTGRWFGVDHWDVRPDVLTAGKGSTSGYFPFGFAACSGEVFETVRSGGFVHGFTWSHNGVGAAVAHAALRRLRDDGLVEASARRGERLLKELGDALAERRVVGDVRGLGLMIGIELVSDRETKAPFSRSARVTERVVGAAREAGLLLYSGTGHVDGGDGDLVMLGPPFVISDEECDLVVERTASAISAVE